jgi:transketolase
MYGYDLPVDERRRFRQLGSRMPGHPEFGHTDGVGTTTGPLGQGLAMTSDVLAHLGLTPAAAAARVAAAIHAETTNYQTRR